MMFVRSIYTGQVMMVDALPKFGGWEVVHEETYIEWCKAHGFEPYTI